MELERLVLGYLCIRRAGVITGRLVGMNVNGRDGGWDNLGGTYLACRKRIHMFRVWYPHKYYGESYCGIRLSDPQTFVGESLPVCRTCIRVAYGG